MKEQFDAFYVTRLALVTTLAILAAISDLRSHRIPNVLLATFMILGLIAWFLGQGFMGFWLSLGPALLVLIALLPLFILRALAGGDVKLFTVIAGLTGIEHFVSIFVMSLLAGGIVGGLIMLRRRQAFQWRDAHMFRQVESVSDSVAIEFQSAHFPFALPILIGTLLGLMGSGQLPEILALVLRG